MSLGAHADGRQASLSRARWVLAVALSLAAVGLLVVLGPARAEAAGSAGGQAIIFVRPSGAAGFGHVGWGFYDPATQEWTYGAVEGGPANPIISPGEWNGAWEATSDYGVMFNTMNQLAYTVAIPITTTSANVAAANVYAVAQFGAGYNLINCNCAGSVYSVLSAYGVTGLPSPDTTLTEDVVPNSWVVHIYASGITDTALSVPAVAQQYPQSGNPPVGPAPPLPPPSASCVSSASPDPYACGGGGSTDPSEQNPPPPASETTVAPPASDPPNPTPPDPVPGPGGPMVASDGGDLSGGGDLGGGGGGGCPTCDDS